MEELEKDLSNQELSAEEETESSQSIEEGSFNPYPFPQNLKFAAQIGRYKIVSFDGSEAILEASSAKEAIEKSNVANIKKVIYLGFYNKLILKKEDIINDPM